MNRLGRMLALPLSGAAISIALGTNPAAAQANDESAYIAELRTCQTIPDSTDRLACFDKAVSSIVAASSAGEVAVVDREEVRKTRRKLFGFTLPDLGIFGGGSDDDDAEESRSLMTTIAGVRTASGNYVLITEEGAQWQLDEMPARLMRPKPGQSVEIRKGALSSYFLRIDGQKGVKGRRIQ